jgi:hypothetical protein
VRGGKRVAANAEQERRRLRLDHEGPRPVDRDLDRKREQVGAPDRRRGQRRDERAARDQRDRDRDENPDRAAVAESREGDEERV